MKSISAKDIKQFKQKHKHDWGIEFHPLMSIFDAYLNAKKTGQCQIWLNYFKKHGDKIGPEDLYDRHNKVCWNVGKRLGRLYVMGVRRNPLTQLLAHEHAAKLFTQTLKVEQGGVTFEGISKMLSAYGDYFLAKPNLCYGLAASLESGQLTWDDFCDSLSAEHDNIWYVPGRGVKDSANAADYLAKVLRLGQEDGADWTTFCAKMQQLQNGRPCKRQSYRDYYGNKHFKIVVDEPFDQWIKRPGAKAYIERNLLVDIPLFFDLEDSDDISLSPHDLVTDQALEKSIYQQINTSHFCGGAKHMRSIAKRVADFCDRNNSLTDAQKVAADYLQHLHASSAVAHGSDPEIACQAFYMLTGRWDRVDIAKIEANERSRFPKQLFKLISKESLAQMKVSKGAVQGQASGSVSVVSNVDDDDLSSFTANYLAEHHQGASFIDDAFVQGEDQLASRRVQGKGRSGKSIDPPLSR